MIKSNKGISLISLLITIALMTIIAAVTVDSSLNRTEANEIEKLINDLELLEDKVSNYYLRYNTIPVVRDENNNVIKYTYTTLDFEKDVNDNENYYIIDLKAMDGISLNYGEVGFKNPNTSTDVYIINEKSHSIYYVAGVSMDGKLYHSFVNTNDIADTIPPSKPEIKIISGEQNEEGVYTTAVSIEFVPGKDSVSGIEKTTYSINDATEEDISTLTNNIFRIFDTGIYNIQVRSYDKNGNISDTIKTIETETTYNFSEDFQELEYIELTGNQYINTGYLPNSNTNAKYKVSIASFATYGPHLLSSQNYYFPLLRGGTNILAKRGNQEFSTTQITPIANKIYEIEAFWEGKIIVNGEEVGTLTSTGASDTTPLYLGTYGGSKDNVIYKLKGKIYYCKIYDGDTLVRDFIPCIRVEDNTVGMYNKVNNAFYQSDGSEQFIAGPKFIEDEAGDTP